MLKKLIILIALYSLGSSTSQAQQILTEDSSVVASSIPSLPSRSEPTDFFLNNIELTNRSQCAINSNHPTKSAFLIVDGYNAGRLGHGLALSTQGDSEVLAKKGMFEFRKSLSLLIRNISQKLNQGDLPLLPSDLNTSNLKYAQIAKNCHSEVYCPELRSYLMQIWLLSEKKSSPDKNLALQKIDLFTSQNFVPQALKSDGIGIKNYCYYLKKFSPLESHLFGNDIGQKGLESLAEALKNKGSYLTDCLDSDSDLDSRTFSLQLEIKSSDPLWEKVGFDYWNSLKIYLSWAWRNATELKGSAPTFFRVFQNLDLEDSLFFVSNGCRSLTSPRCDQENLSLNSLRELAKVKVQSQEFDTPIGSSAEKELLKKGARAVNNDFLSLLSYENSNEWVQNFRENFKERQTVIKNKLLNSHQFFSILTSTVTANRLSEDVLSYSKATAGNPEVKKDLYYMCAEWSLSANPEFDFFYSDVIKVTEINSMLKQSSTVGLDLPHQIEFFKKLSTQIKTVCNDLENNDFFDFTEEDFPSREGYRLWAQEILTPIQESSFKIKDPSSSTGTRSETSAYLSSGDDAVTICSTSIDCVRDTFKYAIDLLHVSKFAKAFLSEGQVQSAELFNPYNELQACQVYDPYFMKKRVQKRFISDIANTIVSVTTGIPLYLDMDFVPNKVTSLNQMIKDGEVQFDPDIQKSHIAMAAVADLGPLAGAPCAIQVSPHSDKAFNFYAFGGLSLNACKTSSDRGISYKSAKDASVNKPTDRSFCFGCVLNFVGVTSAVSYAHGGINANNPILAVVYIFRSIYRFFKGMKEPVNIPRTVNLDLPLLQRIYNAYEGIPSSCIEDFKAGRFCKVSYCEAKSQRWVEENAHGKLKRPNINKKTETKFIVSSESSSKPTKVKETTYSLTQRDQCGFEYRAQYKCDEGLHSFEKIHFEKSKISKGKCSPEKKGLFGEMTSLGDEKAGRNL